MLNAAGELDADGKQLRTEQVRNAFSDFAQVWDMMFPVERFRFIQEVMRQATVFSDKVKIEYNTEGLKQTMRNAGEDARCERWWRIISIEKLPMQKPPF